MVVVAQTTGTGSRSRSKSISRATGAVHCALCILASMLRTMASTCRIALCQIMAGSDKAANLGIATEAIARAAEAHRANIVALPECFNRCAV